MGELFELGAKVKDKATGFVGVVTARLEIQYGGTRYKIEGLATDGHIIEEWLDHGRLEAVTD